MPQLAFVQLTVQDMERALSLYRGRLEMGVDRQQELSGPSPEARWRLKSGSTAALSYVSQVGLPGGAGLRLLQVTPASPKAMREDREHYYPGPFGYSFGVDDVEKTYSAYAEFGAVRMSDPQFFPGPADKPIMAATEFVLRMPGSYYVMLYHVAPGSPRYHQTAANGVSEVRSVAVVSREPSETDRFWEDVVGFEVTIITDGVNDTWNTSRALPMGTRISSGSFHAPGGLRGPVYRVAMIGLSDQMESLKPDVGARGCCLAGFRVEDLPATLERVRSGGYAILDDSTVDVAPWSNERVAVVQAPDGLLVELGQG